MKNKKLFFILGLTIVLLLSACRVSVDKEKTNDKEVSVVLKTISSPYWKYVIAGAEKAGADLGVKVTVVGPSAESEVIQQVNMLEDQLSQSPDAIVVAPSQAETVIPVLERATDDGVPILLIDTDAKFKGKITFIGTDNITAGRTAGKELAKRLKKGDKIALIGGALGNPSIDQRLKGAKEELEKAGLVVAAQQYADSDKTKAMNVTENILEKDDTIKGIYAGNDDMAIGAYRAVESIKKDILVYGTDGTEEAIKSILAGKLGGTVAQSPYNMGYQGIENAVKVANGKKIDKRIDSGIDIIQKDNAQKQLDFLKSITK